MHMSSAEAVSPWPNASFGCNSLLKYILEPKIVQNSLKPPIFRGSRSLKVIDVDIPKKLIASACYKQHVCAHLQPFSR